MKWSKKLDRYIVKHNKSMNEQRNLCKQEDRVLFWVTIGIALFYAGLGLIYLLETK